MNSILALTMCNAGPMSERDICGATGNSHGIVSLVLEKSPIDCQSPCLRIISSSNRSDSFPTLCKYAHWSLYGWKLPSTKNAIPNLASFALQRKRYEIPKSSFWQIILVRDKTVVGFERDSCILVHGLCYPARGKFHIQSKNDVVDVLFCIRLGRIAVQ